MTTLTGSPGQGVCDLCVREAAGGPRGGWLYQDEQWAVCIHDGYEVPGWLVMQLRRHAVGPSGMSHDEARSFGVLVQRVTSALLSIEDVEKVYLVAFGENYSHWHVLFASRLRTFPSELKGTTLLAARGELIDPVAALKYAQVVQEWLFAHSEGFKAACDGPAVDQADMALWCGRQP